MCIIRLCLWFLNLDIPPCTLAKYLLLYSGRSSAYVTLRNGNKDKLLTYLVLALSVKTVAV